MKRDTASRRRARSGTARDVDAHFAAVLPSGRRALRAALRHAIRAAFPEATQGIRCRRPPFPLAGRPLALFAAFGDRSTFRPVAAAIRADAATLGACPTSMGSIRFRPDEPLPASLVPAVVKTRMQQMRTGRM